MPDDQIIPPPPDPAAPPVPPSPDPADIPLGPAGQRALDAMKAELKAAKAETKTATEQLAAIQVANETAAEAAIRAAREEVEKGIRDELSPELAKARLELAVIRSAGTKLADPTDALQFIDAASVTGADGMVDVALLTAAIDALVVAKPYLAGGPAAPVQVPGGPRSETDPKSLPEQIAAARAAGDLDLAIGLSLQQLPAASAP